MKTGVLADKYDITSQYRVLFLCEVSMFYQRIIKAFLKKQNLKPYRSHFLCASVRDFLVDPLGQWVNPQEPESPIKFITGR